MGYLSTAFLVALPLAAAPILLHLFDRRRKVVIEWGAMQFLLEAASRRTSARKFKQYLLLFLRVAAIALLVFGLAGPLSPKNWFGSAERGETIIIVDNSMSMTRTQDEISLLSAAIERAVEVLNEVPVGDSVRLLTTSPYPVWLTPGSISIDELSREQWADRLRELEATHGRGDLLAALATASQAELDPTHTKRRIVLLTDGQRADWDIDDEDDWQQVQEVLAAASVPTELEIARMDQTQQPSNNIAVNSVLSNRTVVGVNQPFTLTAHVKNHGGKGSLPSKLHWKIGDETTFESEVPSLDGGGGQDVVWKHSLDKPGVYALSCEVSSDDELTADNRATVVIEVVNEVPVLLVESSPQLAELQRDAFFVQAALGWIDGEPLADRGVHVPVSVSTDLSRVDLDSYRAVVLPNLQALDEESAERLRDFVEKGGGLWIALGPRTDVEDFNHLMFAEGNGLAPLAVERIVDERRAEGVSPLSDPSDATTTKINPSAKEHPATAELANNEQLDLGDVTVERRFRFTPPPPGEDASVLLSLTNGEPLAVENYVGRGRVIVQAIPLRMQWSGLARSESFVVMVRDWLAYLTQPRATRHNLSPGDPIIVHIADTENRDAILRTAQGDEIELTADTAGDGLVFRSGRTSLPGDYVLELGVAGDQIPFHVNRDTAESDLAPLSADEHTRVNELAAVSTTAAVSREGENAATNPIWPIVLMILIGIVAAELLLSGMIARERFGTKPIAETSEHFGDSVARHSVAGSAMLSAGEGSQSRTTADMHPQLTNNLS